MSNVYAPKNVATAEIYSVDSIFYLGLSGLEGFRELHPHRVQLLKRNNHWHKNVGKQSFSLL
jgi:hypothetical protein